AADEAGQESGQGRPYRLLHPDLKEHQQQCRNHGESRSPEHPLKPDRPARRFLRGKVKAGRGTQQKRDVQEVGAV
ncbi:MAG: hypothetical protein Q8L99_14595, partial [Polycyclovorans sp.]|nr:hypothetical protein [Polycyclovorans sp.]